MLVTLSDVIVAHRGRTLLGPLSLTVEEGDFWGIVGPNGAGKSTLLTAIAGLREISGGRLTRASQIQANRRRAIGVLLQHHSFISDLPITVRDVISFGRLPWHLPPAGLSAHDLETVDEAIRQLGLGAVSDRLFRELSGGERRKVHLARLLAQEPRLVLLDEPTAGLDLDWQERLTGLVQALHHGGTRTVVMVTHDLASLPPCCTHALLLKDGRAIAAGSPSHVLQPGALGLLYDCDVEVEERDGRHHVFARHRSAGP